MRKHLILAVLLLAGSVLLFAQAAGTGTAAPNETAESKSKPAAAKKADPDKMFVAKAAQGGLAEVELGKLAVDKASNPDVKQFGQRMVDDHTKANDQLKSVAGQQNYQVPAETDAQHKAMMKRLSGLSGAAFDRAYMRNMVMDHKKDVAEFQKESAAGKNDAVKGFASQTLPTLRDHLKSAQEISEKLGGGAKKKAEKTSAETR